jgi:hypothetical protein
MNPRDILKSAFGKGTPEEAEALASAIGALGASAGAAHTHSLNPYDMNPYDMSAYQDALRYQQSIQPRDQMQQAIERLVYMVQQQDHIIRTLTQQVHEMQAEWDRAKKVHAFEYLLMRMGEEEGAK